MGVQVPPFAPSIPLLILVVVTSVATCACQSEVERLQGESIYHLDQAVTILERTAGNLQQAMDELDKYLVDHRDRMLDARARGIALMRKMSPDEQERFKRRALEKTRVLRERLDTLARTFSDPPRVLMKVQQFM